MEYLYIVLIFATLFFAYYLLSKKIGKKYSAVLYVLYKIVLFLSMTSLLVLIVSPFTLIPDNLLACIIFLLLIWVIVYFLFAKNYLSDRKKLKYLVEEIKDIFGVSYKRDVIWENYRYCYRSKLSQLCSDYLYAIGDLIGCSSSIPLIHNKEERKILTEKAGSDHFRYIYGHIALSCTKSIDFDYELFLFCEQHLVDKDSYFQKRLIANLFETSHQCISYSKKIPNKLSLREHECKNILSYLCKSYAQNGYKFSDAEHFAQHIEKEQANTKKSFDESYSKKIDFIFELYLKKLKTIH
jgi:hypothetical protein